MKQTLLMLAAVVGVVSFGCDGGAATAQGPVTPSELMADPSAYVSRTVAVVGRIVPDRVMCTLMGCPEEDPCCNYCSGTPSMIDLDAADDAPAVELRASDSLEEGLTCTGDECGVTCEPMRVGGDYSVLGVWRQDEDGTYFVSVNDYVTYAPAE